MKMKTLISVGAIISTLATSALGSVFFTVDVGSLQDEAGDALVQEGMLYLVSSGTDGNFDLPGSGAIVGNDDAIVASWDLTAEVSTVGEYIVSSGEVAYDGAWMQGHTLAILWFPNLTAANQVPAAGEAYGFYRSADVVVGDVWEMPLDGTLLHSLKFFTEGSNPLVMNGDVLSYVAAASFGAGEDAGAPVINLAGLSTSEPTPMTATFSWSGSTNTGGGYQIERRLGSSGDWTFLADVDGSTTSYNDGTIGRGKNYEYRVIATNGFGTEMSAGQSIETLRSNLGNLATRGVLGSGENVLILGFAIQGTGQIQLLTRTQGPELASKVSVQTSVDPFSTLFESIFDENGFRSEFISDNDDWADSQLTEINAAFDGSIANANSDEASKDSAIVLDISGSRLFTIVSTELAEGVEGLANVEVFEVFGDTAPNDTGNRIVNLSTRGRVGTGDNILIGGFYVRGVVDSRVLIRGVGPNLTLRGVNGVLEDPKITLFESIFDENGFRSEERGMNDNWEDNDPELIAEVTGLLNVRQFDAGSKDAAMVIRLSPGLYTFKMEGVADGEGIGLVEVFLAD